MSAQATTRKQSVCDPADAYSYSPPTKLKFQFTPETTSFKINEIPSFFQKRLDLRDKRLKQVEKEREAKICREVDQKVKQYVDTEISADNFEKKPMFANMHPGSKVFNAILQGRGGTSVGNLTFKNAKRVSPLEKFKYRKYLKIDTVTGNKKFFHENPHLKEFAKASLPPGYASEAKR